MKSRPKKSPWGIHKTRLQLRSTRILRAIDRTREGKKSIMPMRFFDWKMSRLDMIR